MRENLFVLLLISHSVIFSELASGVALFEKRYGYRLPSSDGTARTHLVRDMLQCDILCRRRTDGCTAANVVYVRSNVYSCQILSELQTDFNDDHLVPNSKGKFIRFRGECTEPML